MRLIMKKIFLLLILFIMPCVGFTDIALIPLPKAVVLPYNNITKKAGTVWITEHLADAVRKKLEQHGATIVDVQRTADALAAAPFEFVSLADYPQAIAIGRDLSASVVLVGTIAVVGDQLQLTCHILSMESESLIGTVVETGLESDYFSIQNRFTQAVTNFCKSPATWYEEGRKELENYHYCFTMPDTSGYKSFQSKPETVRENARMAILDKAMQSFLQATKLKPDFADAYRYLGKVAILENKMKIAADAYEKAIKSDPSQMDYYEELGKVYLEIEPEKSIKVYRAALMVDPYKAEIRLKLINVLKELERYPEALAECQIYKDFHGDNEIKGILKELSKKVKD
jgi:TolB-like protein